ncbi:MAG: hypothetical protein ABIQ02_05605, partial [Saprospiraceae bacterium]
GIKLKNLKQMKTTQFFATALTVIALATFTTSCMQDEVVAPASHDASITFDQTGSSGAILTAPDFLYGRATKEYTKDWWTYVVRFPRSQNPLNSASVSAPKLGQLGPIQDLFGVKNGSINRNIDATFNKPILVPVINTIRTYPGTDPNAKPAKGQSVDQYLKASADNFIRQATDVRISLDGEQMDAADIKRLTTDEFKITANKDLANYLDLGLTGKEQTAVSDGFWFIANDLPRGKHVLVTHAEVPTKGITADVTYTITVR